MIHLLHYDFLPSFDHQQGLQQNSHGDEPLEKALENIFDLIPTGDPYGTRDLTKCLRCAVVGNSGNLNDSKYGTLIDSHNMVIR